jgi:predicted nucleic acid-binding Zn ribbon protein
VVRDVQPATALARVQAAWPEVAGPALADAATPVSERDGVVTFACRSAVWAQELELMAPDLQARLEAALGGGAARSLRFRVGSGPNRF